MKRGPGKPFKKGKTGNPKGSSARKREERAIAQLTSEQVLEVGSLILGGNVAAVREAVASDELSALQVWIASITMRGIEEGCAQSFTALLNRFVGKPKESVTVSGDKDNPIMLDTTDKMRARIAEIRKMRKELGDD